MATKTLGTNANNSLVALPYSPANLDADIATLQQMIFDDQVESRSGVQRIYPGAFVKQGQLYIPNRGYLTPLVGDYIAVDVATGWPILVSGYAAANGPYTHT